MMKERQQFETWIIDDILWKFVNVHIASDVCENCENYETGALNIQCVFHFSLQLLFKTFLILINKV
jgi:hypothetical protein